MKWAPFAMTLPVLELFRMLPAAAQVPGPEMIARAVDMPGCTVFVDGSGRGNSDGSAREPFRTIAAAIAGAQPGAVICVAEGTYPEELRPGEKYFTLAGGFQHGQEFRVRDSAAYITTAKGIGGSFLRIEDPAPKEGQLTAIDGFEIAGYSQAVFRDVYYSQNFDISNSFIHDNSCGDHSLVGGGFALNNVSGTIRGNVFRNNSCGRGGAGFLNDSANANAVAVKGNLIEGNSGTEADASHGGALYLFGNSLRIADNLFLRNRVTQWGGGLYVGAYTPGNQPTTATVTGNIYRGNQAGDGGGGFFCDDGATCIVSYDIYDGNCGGNILLDGGAQGSGPTTATFDHITSVFARTPDCSAPGAGVFVDTYEVVAPDNYSFKNSIFRDNAQSGDFATACETGCKRVSVSVADSIVQTEYADGSIAISFRNNTGTPVETTVEPNATASGIDDKPPPAVARGGDFMGFPEKFNRYYTDPGWMPLATLYVSPEGGGDGLTRSAPMAVKDAVAAARPGTLIRFLPGVYEGGANFETDAGGTYDAPIVLYAERNGDFSPGVEMRCASAKREACINLEGADHIAIDGFAFTGGNYGLRAVGQGYAASQHSRGIAVLNSVGTDQDRDPFFTGQSDWAVFERNAASGAKAGDGHGFYLSNGGDWNIVRFNETHGNASSDFQINADPASTCEGEGIAFDDPRCDAYGGEGEGGQGASDYFLVDGNYFHHGLGPGANFTSVRRSIIRNNVFGLHATRHNVSFWQETDNPRLGSSDNEIVHNLFISTGRHGVQFSANSTRNRFENNVVFGVTLSGGNVAANSSALLLETDGTADDNVYRSNFYGPGLFEGYRPNETETVVVEFSADWFGNFPVTLNHDPNDFTPQTGAPFLKSGKKSLAAPADRNGVRRGGEVDLGPIERPKTQE